MGKKGMEPGNKGKNQKTGINYNEIKDLYVTGSYTLKQLAEQFGIRQNTLEVQSAKEHWKQQKDEYKNRYKEELRKKLKSEIIENEIEINRKHYGIWNKVYDIIDEILENKDTELRYENGKFQLGKVETIANIMVQTQGGQRLAAGLIEASKLKDLELNERRVANEEKKLAGPDIDVKQDRSFIDALAAGNKDIWKDTKVEQPEDKPEEGEGEENVE